MNVYIIIVTYNAMPWIQRCLSSCAGYRVLVVDNASTDGTLTYIKEEHPEVHVMPQQKNLGFGSANNRAMTYALEKGARAVFLLNQDAYLEEGCIVTLLKAHKDYPEYGILSPIHLNGAGKRLDRSFSHCMSFDYSPDFYSDFVLQKPRKQLYETPFINAAGWLLTREILNTVGGFDPLFFHYGEDTNYCQRATYHGFRIGVVPTAFMRHDREDRIRFELKRGTLEFLNTWERSLKTRYGNINVENLKELLGLKRPRLISKWKAYITGDFKMAKILAQEVEVLSNIIPAISKSRDQNVIKGKHYLN